MWNKKKIETKITQKMREAFSGTEDRKNAVHLAAAAGAGIVAALPIGVDAWALRLCEVIMVVCIASSYGECLTKSAAKGIMLSSFAQLAGETAAIAALEAAEAAKYATAGTGIGPVAAFAIKSGIAVGLIEAVGWLLISYYEDKNSVAAKVCTTVEKIGLVADITRAVNMVGDAIDSEDHNPEPISFCGKKEGKSYGHTESYWKARLKSAIERGDLIDIKFYTKWLNEAIANRPE